MSPTTGKGFCCSISRCAVVFASLVEDLVRRKGRLPTGAFVPGKKHGSGTGDRWHGGKGSRYDGCLTRNCMTLAISDYPEKFEAEMNLPCPGHGFRDLGTVVSLKLVGLMALRLRTRPGARNC